MKTPKILIPILLSLLLAACEPGIDTQSIVETSIAQTAQISQLETAAAGNGAQSEDQANQPVQDQEQVNFWFGNNNNTTVCSIDTYVIDREVNLLAEKGFVLDPGEFTSFDLPSGIYDIFIYDCNSNLVDQLDGFLIDSNTEGINSNGTAGNQSSPVNISGKWNSSLGWLYDITQNGSEFSWTVTHQNITEQASGSISGMSVQATWSDPNGSGSGSGVIVADSTGKAIRIEWDNGVIFTKENQSSNTSGVGSAQFTASQDTNCRYGPSSTNFDIQRTILKGQSVTIVGKGNAPAQGWWVVQVDSAQCWVWGDLGASSGNLQNVPGINPPAAPAVPQPEQNGGNDQQTDACQDINPVVMVDPSNGPHPTTFTFSISGFVPNSTVSFEIFLLPDTDNHIYYADLNTNGNGNASIKLNSEATDPSGQYWVLVLAPCPEGSTDAVFILE